MKYLIQYIVECERPEQALLISAKKQNYLITELVEKDTYKPTSYYWLDDPNAPIWVLCEGDSHPIAEL